MASGKLLSDEVCSGSVQLQRLTLKYTNDESDQTNRACNEEPVNADNVVNVDSFSKESDVENMLRNEPEIITDTNCILKNKQGKLMCTICNRKVFAGGNNITDHLLGKNHKQHMNTFSQVSEDNQSIVKTESSLQLLPIFKEVPAALHEEIKSIKAIWVTHLHCSICDRVLTNHVNDLKDHLLGKHHIQTSTTSSQKSKVKKQIDGIKSKNSLELLNIFEKLPVDLHNEIKFIKVVPFIKLHCSPCGMNIQNHITCLTKHLQAYDHKKSVIKCNLKNKSDTLKHIIRNLPQEMKDTDYVVENEKGKLKCLICDCAIFFDATSITSHLLGQEHIKNKNIYASNIKGQNSDEAESSLELLPDLEQIPETQRKFIKPISDLQIRCLICKRNVQKHINCVKDHLNGAYHNKREQKYNSNH